MGFAELGQKLHLLRAVRARHRLSRSGHDARLAWRPAAACVPSPASRSRPASWLSPAMAGPMAGRRAPAAVRKASFRMTLAVRRSMGAATVTRRQSNDISGHTLGGGIEFKAMENLIFRADYWRDHYTWNAIVCGGAGFGGTVGNITVSSFSSCLTPVKIRNEAFQASIIYQFWNPQGSAAAVQARRCWRSPAHQLTAGRVRAGRPGVQGGPGRDPGATPGPASTPVPMPAGAGAARTGPVDAVPSKAPSTPKAGSPAPRLATTIRSTSGCSASRWTAASPTSSASG